MIAYSLHHHRLAFNFAAKTSRSSLSFKDCWYVVLKDDEGKSGIGEIAPLEGLSLEYQSDFESIIHQKIQSTLPNLPYSLNQLDSYPSIRFGMETAWKDLNAAESMILHPSPFTSGDKGIRINGLIWMGTLDFMMEQLHEKIAKGFTCIKIKVGAIQWEDELRLFKAIRNEYEAKDLEIRIDANGAFPADNALEKLNQLAKFRIHSIEQPIKAGQTEAMAGLCRQSPIPVALDEELIGKYLEEDRQQLLEQIRPQYIILKPSLTGGIQASEEWISIAENLGIAYWVTSALEGNIGLNAIAQWTARKNPVLPQGLGTGQLYSNNIPSPLTIRGEELYYEPEHRWQFPYI